ncbi:MAG: divalent-cation tolerance protein CutA, partial [Verrucomicrobia bacterium]|nr:divalent-cation tolerance protein CutA [Verrucomicrobiota bacterium]
RTIAGDALEKRLVACANLISGVESHFHWEDRVETESEVLMILKTTDAQVERLKQVVVNRHA